MPKKGSYKQSIEELEAVANRYDYLPEFRKKEPRIYDAIQRRGLIDSLCKHMRRGRPLSLTNEELKEIASHYDYMPEFRSKEKHAYDTICRRGLLEEYCTHIQRDDRSTPEEVLAAKAKKYNTFQELIKNDYNTYAIITARGLTDKLCAHMRRIKRYRYKEEELAERALMYDDFHEFSQKEPSVYAAILDRGLADKLCAHMKRRKKYKYTYDELVQISSGYDILQEFYNNEKGAYKAIKRRGLFQELCGHMKRKGDWHKRKVYVFTFSDGYAYVGLSLNPERRFLQHTKDKKSPVYKHIQETGTKYEYKILTDWIGANIAGEVEESYIRRYSAEGWKLLNKAKGGGLGWSSIDMSHDKLKKEAAKYHTFEEFQEYSPYCYYYMLDNGMLDAYCKHLKHSKDYAGKTINDKLEIIAGCKTRMELNRKSAGIYKWARKNGLLDKYFPKRVPAKRRRSYTDEERIFILKSCKNRRELAIKYGAVNDWAKANNLLDKYLPVNGKYTDEERMEIIKSCSSRSELRKKSSSVYYWLRDNGLLDEYFPCQLKRLTNEERIEILKSCRTRTELNEKYRFIYVWARKHGLLDIYIPAQSPPTSVSPDS